MLKNIFGSDSETEEDSESQNYITRALATSQHTRKENNSESEMDDDVLDISVENELALFSTPTKESQIVLPKTPSFEYITPSKVQQLLQVRPLISPLARTPQPNTTLFATSPYSIRIQSPMHLLTQDNNVARSQSLVTVHNNVRYEAYLKHQLRVKERGCTPLKCIKFEYVPRLTATKSAETEHQHEVEQQSSLKLHAPTYTRFQEQRKQHTSVAHLRTHADIVSQVAARTKASEVEHVHTHNQAHKQVRTIPNRFAPYNKRTAPTVAGIEETEIDNVDDAQLSLFLRGRRFCLSSNASIIERHNFEREIQIDVKSDQYRPTN